MSTEVRPTATFFRLVIILDRFIRYNGSSRFSSLQGYIRKEISYVLGFGFSCNMLVLRFKMLDKLRNEL